VVLSAVSPIVIAIGAVLAALIAGFFSFVSLVSAKESKVSEFRLSWIDGLREEIARFTASIHELVRLKGHMHDLTAKEWLDATAEPYRNARESLTAIQLRLNPKHVDEQPNSSEAKLMRQIQLMREAFLKAEYDQVVDGVDQVRVLAAPLLKNEWERVKVGELAFRRVRLAAALLLLVGLSLLALAGYRLTLGPQPEPQASPIEMPAIHLQALPTQSAESTTPETEPRAESEAERPTAE
jgi:hypothetical protein